VSWTALERDPDLARPFTHLVALDPPDSERAEPLLAHAPVADGRGRGYACWGEQEIDFAARAAAMRFDFRPALTTVYRAVREAGSLAGEELERALCGEGAHPREPELCARLVRVLDELGLASYTSRAEGGPSWELRAAVRTELERSPMYRVALDRLEEARRYLRGPALRAKLDIATREADPDLTPRPHPAVAVGVAA
jgi:single-stranded-DNA-specific exonuclease